MTNQAWEDFKEKYIQLAKEEGMKKGIKKGRKEGRSEGIEEGRSEGIDSVLEVMGISKESYLSSKREYDLKHNLA